MIMLFLRSLSFNVFFYVSSMLFCVLLIFFCWLPRTWVQRLIVGWLTCEIWALGVVAGVRFEVRGRENLPPGPAILVSKHQSAWDTGIFCLLVSDPAYVLKKELIWLPFYGWLLKRVEMVAVDRSAGASALKSMIRQARRALDKKRHVIIFPEGTRGATGTKGHYHPGVAALDRAFDQQVVPVALNSGLYWPRRSFVKRPGTIIIEFLPAMPKGLERKTFMADLENRIETATDRLLEEGARGDLSQAG